MSMNHYDTSAVFDQDGDEHEHVAPELHQPRYQYASSVADRFRFGLAKFAHKVGMKIPGLAYSALPGRGGNRDRTQMRTLGGGIQQDGVFSNMNAKPERQRRANSGDPDDLGEDDDIADDTLPPTYDAAAVDTVPTYWESTVFGANPMVDLEGGWSPDGPHVGEVSDMIVDGMLLGSVFGLLWNMVISVCFQFIGFILTFLLHTTHAAKYGSCAGLGISLVQYSLSLFERAYEIAKEAQKEAAKHRGKEKPPNQNQHLPSAEDLRQVRTIAYIILVLGIFAIFHSIIRFALMYRKGFKLVAAANAQAQTGSQLNGSGTQELNVQPTGFFESFANPVSSMVHSIGRLRNSILTEVGLLSNIRDTHSAEDYIIHPRGANVVFSSADDADGPLPSHVVVPYADPSMPQDTLHNLRQFMFPTSVEELENIEFGRSR
ncbi:hypothetical protein MVES_001871 [Malassezia vespertilionis]|uniref:Uncharacterized protein n=2 Tax=Malassezia vespertilionis TaxID=2020962 RepID=A0A2N1JBL6_9BASI|nr:hypothetical protein MVES_001871 [Malassezia vespertilionis]